MIELATGVPGSGKTLSRVQKLATFIKRWATHPEEARPIFISGIPELSLPHSVMPLKSVQINKAGSPSLVPDWDSMPDGSLVIIDECQGCFPPRSSASTAPEHVAWLNVHRHRGFDIWLITQHPKLIDASVRALVGKHQHYRRLFGGMRAAVYEWDACSDNLSGMKTAVISYWSYPRKVYEWYKSAEVHTKQTFKLPKWLLIPFAGLALGAFFLPKAFGILSNGISGKGLNNPPVAAVPASKPALQPQVTQAQGGAIAPTVAQPSADYTKPFKDDTEKPERSINELKLAHGVYSDDPSLLHHFSTSELKRQEKNSRLLNDRLAASERLVQELAQELSYSNNPLPVVYHEREKIGSYHF